MYRLFPVLRSEKAEPAVKADAAHVGGQVGIAGLFLLSAAIGTALGDQPTITAFCWGVGLAAVAVLTHRWLQRPKASGAPAGPRAAPHPRRWGVSARG